MLSPPHVRLYIGLDPPSVPPAPLVPPIPQRWYPEKMASHMLQANGLDNLIDQMSDTLEHVELLGLVMLPLPYTRKRQWDSTH